MPNREYEKGARAERELMADAINRGFAAYRGAGSHGAYDVAVSLTNGVRCLVNIKCNTWAGPADRRRLISLATSVDIPLLARKRDRKGWDYRRLNDDGSMGAISVVPPWH